MRAPFPFELPPATLFYVVLYLLTFVLHVVFMHYVVAGSLYVFFAAAIPIRGAAPRTEQPLVAILRDWLPFVLSAAITAGVAPLLFVQVLYRKHFYSANLLLGWRWMLIVPVLVIGFYLLYLLKTRLAITSAWWLRVLIAAGAVICFLFIGMSWSVNHLISLRGDQWPSVYLTRELPFSMTTLLPRVGIWLAGSFATMAAVAGWQLLAKRPPSASQDEQPDWECGEVRRLTMLSWCSVAAALSCAIAYVLLDSSIRRAAFGSEGLGYTIAVFVGAVLQVLGWWMQRRTKRLHSSGMTFVSVGILFALLGTAAVREIHRLNLVQATDTVAYHIRAAQIGGFEVFLIFAVVNIGLVALCVRLVRSEP
jgi:hypothetical protein